MDLSLGQTSHKACTIAGKGYIDVSTVDPQTAKQIGQVQQLPPFRYACLCILRCATCLCLLHVYST